MDEIKQKRGRPALFDDAYYKVIGKVLNTGDRRVMQNSHYSSKAINILDEHKSEIPDLDYLMTPKTKQLRICAFVELGRLYEFLANSYGDDMATGLLVTVTQNICKVARSEASTTRDIEKFVRAKRLDMKANLQSQQFA